MGLITEAMQAEGISQCEQADAIAIARAILYDPRWPWHAAAELGEKIEIAPQYLRCQPKWGSVIYLCRLNPQIRKWNPNILSA